MATIKLLKNLDHHDKRILRALAEEGPQNIYDLQKSAGVSRKAIYSRIKGKYQLKRRKNLEQLDLITSKKGKKSKFGRNEVKLSITFKGLILAYSLNENNSEIKVKISQYKSELDIKDNEAFFAAVKLWINYYAEMLPGKFSELSSNEFHKDFIDTIWLGVRHASLTPYQRSTGSGDPEKPNFYISFPYHRFLEQLRKLKMSGEQIDSLMLHLINKHVIDSEINSLELLDYDIKNNLRKKEKKYSFPLTNRFIRAGCLLVEFKFELDRSKLPDILFDFSKHPDDPIDTDKLLNKIYISPLYQLTGKCLKERNCPFDGEENLVKLQCDQVKSDLLRS